MKNIDQYTFLLLGIVLLFTQCKSSLPALSIANKELEQKFNNSANTWNKLKKQNNDSYEFSINEAGELGQFSITKLVVKKGKVIERTFLKTENNNSGFAKLKEIYKETGRSVGQNSKGHVPITLDQIYQDCAANRLTGNEKTQILSLRLDNNGIINTCGYSLKNCEENCFKGNSISGFKWLE